MKTHQLTEERGKTHGSFKDNAEISQALKLILRGGYEPIYAEAIDMICLKLSRIASGHEDFADHWDDIAGYAHLAGQYAKDKV